MTSRERWWRSGALACLVAACGEAPSPPTAIESPNPPTGTSSAGQTNVLEALPQGSPDSSASNAPGSSVGGTQSQPSGTQPSGTQPPAQAAGADAGVPSGAIPTKPEAPPAAAANEFFGACKAPRLTGCDDVYVTFVSPAADLCVQLSLDDCGVFRQSLQVDVPVAWRVSTATLGKAKNCELGVYDPSSASVVSASGRITWNQDGRVLSDLEIDLTLQAPNGSTPSTVPVKTEEPIHQLVDCDD